MGKTRLVRAVCDHAASNGAAVLWGRGIRFGAVDAPYVAMIGALEGWLESAEPSERAGALAAVPAAAELLPSLGGQPTRGTVRLLPVIDGLLQALTSQRPAVLVVDDVQWADLASRDAITYLVAGFRSQRLAVLTTYRDEEVAAGDPLNVWLADLIRLPSVSSLRLARMGRDETEQQLALLLGSQPDPDLVAAVMGRSEGNPYFTELLVEGLTAADQSLPADLPDELAGALLAAWHRLDAPSREVVRLLAVCGRPASVDDLVEVAAARGIGAETVTVALVAATKNGICVAHGAELCWFRHPLLAEVLNATFVPGEAVPIHTAWARALESRTATAIDELRRFGELARHYEGAHRPAASLAASLRAADLAKQLKALAEEAVHLRRAVRLWPTVHAADAQPPDRELDLLERLASVSDLVGDGEETHAAWSRSLQLVDERRDPLRASRIVREAALSEWWSGRRSSQPFEALEQAVRLAEPFPDSTEYAAALAELSVGHNWADSFEAARLYADEATRAAQRSGSPEALARAYRALAEAYERDERADAASAEALRHARLTGHPGRMLLARWARMAYLAPRRRLTDIVQLDADGLRETLDEGATNVAAFHAGDLARHLLLLGRHTEADQAVREGLTLAGDATMRAVARLAAVLLAVRRGDLDQARSHVRRLHELIPNLEHRAGLWAPPTLAEHLLAENRPDQALELLADTMVIQMSRARVADEMVMLSARAAADLADQARDRRDRDGVTRAQQSLEDIVERRRKLEPPPFARITNDDLITPAVEALHAAETARCLGQRGTSTLWAETANRCAGAGMRWDEAVASHRWAQALLTDGASRAAIAVPLRSAYRLADEMSAGPLRHEMEKLATIARISLDEPHPATVDKHDDAPEVFRSLTRREREILAHLVSGRTYAEIAAALFISEKTVSAHVSNLLRKTGTSSRRDVAALASRLGYPPPH
ncbi:DNA-binding CsgD family transcriptional regulator/tetratricopeptide (TPR) repeat protein [Kribbella shirazensis]|uniref:DNA-binding CsgD family transcriptional regulator/tetratricopeptide (TPR) repeat protein n=1 Tax=Kribbella shirazensis TaxID=1105143 RepID=A0A7X5VE65_9ACTN|nr:DNA-binding CsgD family transcriptional regulator/tetratricopeptide (TPR) repeat protein [Kribbella shirazensis]